MTLDDAASLRVECILVISPKEGLRETCRGRVIKPDEFCGWDHHGEMVTGLLHGNQESAADMPPGRTEKLATSGDSIGAVGHVIQIYGST